MSLVHVPSRTRSSAGLLIMCGFALAAPNAGTAQSFSIDDILSPGYPMGLVSAKASDRLAWVEVERGIRCCVRGVHFFILSRFEGRRSTCSSKTA